MREITYSGAILEALDQEMARDASVFVYGIGANDHVAIFGSTQGLVKKYGSERCRDTPIAEDTMTGIGIGAAIAGMRPVHVHIRVDFLLLAMNQLVNMAPVLTYTSGGKLKVPLVVRAVIGRGWGQGAQHSKGMLSTFGHVPGLKVIAPTTPYDMKGMLISAIRDDSPVIVLEHRWLYWQTGCVPSEAYEEALTGVRQLRPGKDVTIIATSWMNVEAMQAAKILHDTHGIDVGVVDLRVISPIDRTGIVNAVRETGRCVVVENDWTAFGVSAEISSILMEECFGDLKAPVERLGFAAVPCPTARHLEDEFYPNAKTIIRTIESMLDLKQVNLDNREFYSHENRFKGPF